MKQFLVFAYEYQYPRGGWSDLRGDFADLREAEEFLAAVVDGRCDGGHIVDITTGRIVKYDHKKD